MNALAIDVRGLTKRYDGRAVVDDVTLQVGQGRICGFLGPNGSGKTTTIRMLCGLLRPDAGEGQCLGLDFRREAAAIKRQVGYMTQKFGLYEDLSIRENLDFVARLFQLPERRKQVDAALERAAEFVLNTAIQREADQSALGMVSIAGDRRFLRIAVINDDMPFLVDSVAATISAQGLSIDRLVHPIIPAIRNEAGEIVDLPRGQKAKGAPRESMIYIEADRVDAIQRRELDRALRQTLGDVHVAVRDWPKLREAMRNDAAGLAGIGYDTFNFTTGLDLSGASAANKIMVRIVSFTTPGEATASNPLAMNKGSPHTFAFAFASSVTKPTFGTNIADLFTYDVSQFRYTDGSSSDAGLWAMSFDQSTQMMTLTAVPEPSTYGLGLGALLLAAAAIRRRRPKA